MDRYFGFAKQLLESGLATEEDSYGEGNLYDLTIQIDYDIPFYLELAKQADGLVLDIGCGSGRMLKPLLEEGIDAMGIDLAPAMLDMARQKLEIYGHHPELVVADMRSFRLDKQFALAMIPYFSMIYIHSDEERLQVFQTVYQHLLPNGRFAFDFDAGQIELGESRPWIGMQCIHPLTDEVILQSVQMKGLSENQRLINQITYTKGKKTGISVMSSLESTVSKQRVVELLERVGFQIEAVYGDHSKTPYQGGEECVLVARKPD